MYCHYRQYFLSQKIIISRLKLRNALALPAQLAVKAKPKSTVVSAEIKFKMKRLGYNLTEYKTNTEILNELKITSVVEKINMYGSNCQKKVKTISVRIKKSLS